MEDTGTYKKRFTLLERIKIEKPSYEGFFFYAVFISNNMDADIDSRSLLKGGFAMIFIDMDGVVAKWNAEASVEDTRRRGYFLKRVPEKSVVKLVKALQKLGAPVCILSAAYDENAASEKSIWLDMVFGTSLDRIFVPYGSSKSDYTGGGRGNVLIDDFSSNLHAWEKSGNVGLKFYNGINGTHGSWKGRYITKDMSLGEMLEIVSEVI